MSGEKGSRNRIEASEKTAFLLGQVFEREEGYFGGTAVGMRREGERW